MSSIFNDLVFRAQHAVAGKSKAAGHPHWHRFYVELWFTGAHDQDDLTDWIESHFKDLQGANLHMRRKDSSDEGIAHWILARAQKVHPDCCRVVLRNENRRGVEVP